jgi:hypothetical protein
MLGIKRNPVPKIRKKYDRMREKADKMKDRQTKLQVLRFLDQIEPTLTALEEQDQPKFERRRMLNYIKDNMEQLEDMNKARKDKK